MTGRHVSTFIESSSGPLRKQSQELSFNVLWDPKCLQIVLQECEIHKFLYIGICAAVSALKG